MMLLQPPGWQIAPATLSYTWQLAPEHNQAWLFLGDTQVGGYCYQRGRYFQRLGPGRWQPGEVPGNAPPVPEPPTQLVKWTL